MDRPYTEQLCAEQCNIKVIYQKGLWSTIPHTDKKIQKIHKIRIQNNKQKKTLLSPPPKKQRKNAKKKTWDIGPPCAHHVTVSRCPATPSPCPCASPREVSKNDLPWVSQAFSQRSGLIRGCATRLTSVLESSGTPRCLSTYPPLSVCSEVAEEVVGLGARLRRNLAPAPRAPVFCFHSFLDVAFQRPLGRPVASPA